MIIRLISRTVVVMVVAPVWVVPTIVWIISGIVPSASPEASVVPWIIPSSPVSAVVPRVIPTPARAIIPWVIPSVVSPRGEAP
jgi:hypothetical protein